MIRSDLVKVREFFRDFLIAVWDVPREMAIWWWAAHTRTNWLRSWEDNSTNCTLGGRTIILVGSKGEASYYDYKLWRALGFALNAVLVLIVLLVILTVVL